VEYHNVSDQDASCRLVAVQINAQGYDLLRDIVVVITQVYIPVGEHVLSVVADIHSRGTAL
jgi:hypothetical protein